MLLNPFTLSLRERQLLFVSNRWGFQIQNSSDIFEESETRVMRNKFGCEKLLASFCWKRLDSNTVDNLRSVRSSTELAGLGTKSSLYFTHNNIISSRGRLAQMVEHLLLKFCFKRNCVCDWETVTGAI